MKSLLLSFVLALVGCSHFSTTQDKVHADGTKETTHVSIFTFFDAKSDLSKLKTHSTTASQGMSLGSITENTSGTNTIELLRAVGNILATMPK